MSKKVSPMIQKVGIRLGRQGREGLSRYRRCHGKAWEKMRYLLKIVTGSGPQVAVGSSWVVRLERLR